MPKKNFSLTDEGEAVWQKIWRTKGTFTESAALERIFFEIEEALRRRLDAEALEQYEAGNLTRSEMLRAFERYRARRAATNGGAEKAAAAV
jgi:hypothetical protein